MNYNDLIQNILNIEIDLRLAHIQILLEQNNIVNNDYVLFVKSELQKCIQPYLLRDKREANTSMPLFFVETPKLVDFAYLSYNSVIKSNKKYIDVIKRNNHMIKNILLYISPYHLKAYRSLFNITFSFHNRVDVNTHLLSLKRAATLHHIVFWDSKFISKISLSDCNYGVGDQLFFSPYIGTEMSEILNRDDVLNVLKQTQINHIKKDVLDWLNIQKLKGYGYDFKSSDSKDFFLWSSDILNLSLIFNFFIDEEEATKKASMYWIKRRLEPKAIRERNTNAEKLILDLNSSPLKASLNDIVQLANVCDVATKMFKEVVVLIRDCDLKNALIEKTLHLNNIKIISARKLSEIIQYYMNPEKILAVCVAGASGILAIMGNTNVIIYSGGTNEKWKSIKSILSSKNTNNSGVKVVAISKEEIYNETLFGSRIIKDLKEARS